jgi:cytochrome P450 family 3 subfamily A
MVSLLLACRFYDGTYPVLMVGDPELAYDIMVKNFPLFSNRVSFPMGHSVFDNNIAFTASDAQWKKTRDINSAMFIMGKMRRCMWPRLLESVGKNIERLDGILGLESSLTFDLIPFLFQLIVETAGSCVLNWDMHAEGEELHHKFQDLFSKDIWAAVLFTIGLKDTPTFCTKAATYLGAVIRDKVVKKRREDPNRGTYNDFQDILLGFQPDTTSSLKRKIQDCNEEEIISQLVTGAAGYEGTFATICFLMMNLGNNPEAQEKLRQEILTTLAANGGEIDYETLSEMEYLDAVISESSRLCPITDVVQRAASQDTRVGEVSVPAGTIIHIPIYALQHDEAYFPQAEDFIPERFMKANREKVPIRPGTFIPFGLGPRQCVGMRFALMELKYVLVALLPRFRLSQIEKPPLCPRHEFTVLPLRMRGTVERIG